jgi:outer membrane protein assembly factor BamB
MHATFRLAACAAVAVLACAPAAPAADWPMYRYDAQRTAASPEKLPAALHLQWVRKLPPLKPAWPDQPKMQLDSVYEPVVAGKLLYVGSSRYDCVTAYDIATGAEAWRFNAEGPVRYAPVVNSSKLYFTSDDGYLYCLDAAKGSLVWKFRGGPSDRKILGNERLISTWPARGAPVVADGKVYFAASIWPFMGIFIHCLDAETGKVVWTNDGDGSTYMKQPHNADAFAGVAPQGPLVVADKYLLVPGGRSIPALFDLQTGKWVRYQLAENGKKGGGAQVAATGKHFFNGGAIFLLDSEKQLGAFGDQVVLTSKVGYGYTSGVLKAFDLPSSTTITIEGTDKKGEKTKTVKWKIDQLAALKLDKVEALIQAGDRLYVGRPGEVSAYDLPLSEDSKASWTARIEGGPASLIAANGLLFVVTREGGIYCFGGTANASPAVVSDYKAAPVVDKAAQARAAEMLKATKVRDGYAVVWGAGNGAVVFALVQATQFRLIVIEPNADRAAKLRGRLAAADLDCERVQVCIGQPATFQLPQYLASAMFCEDAAAAGIELNAAFLQRAAQALRPFGGVAVLQTAVAKDLREDLGGFQCPGVELVQENAGVVLRRAGAPPGAGNWTHEHGDAANTRVAKDQIVKAPLGLLWFGGPSHDGILPRHGHGPQPQVIDGRCIIEGVDMLRAIDIYTGRLLWETKLPGIGFFYDNLLHQPGANSSGGNYACVSDSIYAVHGARCVRLDPETGKQTAEFVLPNFDKKDSPPRWGYLNVEGDYLIGGADPLFDEKLFKDATINKDPKGLGDDSPDKTPKKDDPLTKLLKAAKSSDNFSSSKHLAVLDRHTGKVLWTASAKFGFRHNGVCAGNGRLYCIDRLSGPELARLKRRGEEPKLIARLVVYDLKTGQQLWSTETDVFGTWLSYSAKFDVLVEAGRVARDTISDEPKGMRAYNAATGKPLWKHDTYAGPAMILDRTILKDTSACDLLTGEPKMRPHPLTGVPVPWEWARSYGCNTPSASENLLTFRSGAAGFFDLCGDGGTGNLGGFRSSCTNNLIVAGGVLTAPEYTRTCSCLYQNQTSIGLIHMPEAELWTSFGALPLKGTIKHVGINLGAPGDRRGEDGVLWLEYPSVGGKSPTVDVKVAGPKLEWFRRHPSQVEGPMSWVGASGVKGLTSITVKLSKGSLEGGKYTVKLTFAEPDDLAAGQRMFDVSILGHKVLEGFDIVKESGGVRRKVVREFKGIGAIDEITVTFRPTPGAAVAAPVLCGIEILAEEPQGKK